MASVAPAAPHSWLAVCSKWFDRVRIFKVERVAKGIFILCFMFYVFCKFIVSFA